MKAPLSALLSAALVLLLGACRKDKDDPDREDALAATPMNGWEVWTTTESMWMAEASPNALFRSFQQSMPQAYLLERSTDGGATWTRWTTSLLVKPLFQTEVVGFSHYNTTVSRTANGGHSWVALPVEITQVYAFHNVPQRVFARVDTLTHVSSDGGVTWTSLGDAGPQGSLKGMHFPSPDTGYASTDQGIWGTTDAGVTWTLIAPGVRGGWVGHRDVERGVVNYRIVANGGWQNCLARTNDGWATWDTLNITPQVGSMMDVELNDPTGQLYGCGSLFLRRSGDNGQTWEVDFQHPAFYGIRGVFRHGDRLYTWSEHNLVTKYAPL
jgi:photosystem II stability/assembly factor-like uncharacterized protein